MNTTDGELSIYDQRKRKAKGTFDCSKWCLTTLIIPICIALLPLLISGGNPQIYITIINNIINIFFQDNDEHNLIRTQVALELTQTFIARTPDYQTQTPVPSATATLSKPSATSVASVTSTQTPTETLVPTASPMPLQQYYTVQLANGVYWPDGYNLGLTTEVNSVKEQELAGIPFEIGRQINTIGCDNSGNTDNIEINVNLSHPSVVYFLMQAGNGLTQYEGNIIGEIRLHFSDGSIESQDLILGYNIRDWARDKNSTIAVQTIAANTAFEAWRGNAGGPDAGYEGGMDVTMFQIPTSYKDLDLVTIEVKDTTNLNNNTDAPCIHLQAITVER